MSLVTIHYQFAATGDYIFPIIIILAAIFQAFSQNKKKAEIVKANRQKTMGEVWQDEEYQDDSPPQKPRSSSPFGSFFEQIETMLDPDLSKETQSGDDSHSPQREVVKPAVSSNVMHSNITEDELNKEMQKDHSSLNKNQPVKEKNTVKIRRSIRAGFDMKKAVIYSEILNRKYS